MRIPASTEIRIPTAEGMRRELSEEVIIETSYNDTCAGMINDDETEVGKVHLGVVHIFDVETQDVRPREKEIAEAGFVALEQLKAQIDEMESWSQICLRSLFESDNS